MPLREWRPVLRLGGAELGFKRGTWRRGCRRRVEWIGCLLCFRSGDFAVHFGEAERVGFVAAFCFRRFIIARQPAGVRFEGNGRRGQETDAVEEGKNLRLIQSSQESYFFGDVTRLRRRAGIIIKLEHR